jgi:hypothetical protein
VHEPASPREVGSIQAGYTGGIVAKDGLAYVASERGLLIADVSNPEHPQSVGAYDSQGLPHRVHVVGAYAYIASSGGLEIVDISDPRTPVQAAHLSEGEAWGVDIYQDMVYLAVPGSGLVVIDAKEPTSPLRMGLVPETQGAWDVHIHLDLVYVACRDAGIRILSASEKESPEIVGRYRDDDGGEALGVWGNGDHLYVADNFGIEVLDVKDPTHPYEIDEYGGVNGAHDIYVDKEFVYVAEGRKGLIILDRDYGSEQGRAP